MNSFDGEEYWSIDLPGLNESSAKLLLSKAGEIDASLIGSAVDPTLSYTRHLDRRSVSLLRRFVRDAILESPLSSEDHAIAEGLLNDFEDWLGTTEGR